MFPIEKSNWRFEDTTHLDKSELLRYFFVQQYRLEMRMKKKPAVTAPWEVTEEMFLSEGEVTVLLADLRRREQTAEDASRTSAAVDRLIVELLLYSGLRNSELCRLRVIDTIVGHGESSLHVAGTPRQDRTVYIPQATSDLIARFVTDVRPDCLSKSRTTRDLKQPLILNDRGNIYDRTALYRRVVRILTDAGLGERASVQLLRHTYGFLAYKRTGGNLLFVQQQLGHAHPMVTAVYARFVKHPPGELAELIGAAQRSEPQAGPKPAALPRKKGTR
jgi:integrase/recombinase XerD